MKNIPLISCFIILLHVAPFCKANDGTFTVNGNQLVPIQETSISVRKEILTITRKGKDDAEISVYYEFFNPGEAKELLVGFEAFSPEGDADKHPSNGEQ